MNMRGLILMWKLIIIFVLFLASSTPVAAQEPTPTETPISVATESHPIYTPKTILGLPPRPTWSRILIQP